MMIKTTGGKLHQLSVSSTTCRGSGSAHAFSKQADGSQKCRLCGAVEAAPAEAK